MGVLFDYFSAPSDEEAAAVIDRVGGPGSQATQLTGYVEPKRGIFGRRRPAVAPTFGDDTDLTVYDTVSVRGIDPLVQLGTLEELLTGRPYDEAVADPRSGVNPLASKDGGEVLVAPLTDSLTSALANADGELLEQVARPWSETEEFWGAADPSDLGEFLKELAALASRAEATGQRLYCWVCV